MDAAITARVPGSDKEAAAVVLSQLNLTASQLIQHLWAYMAANASDSNKIAKELAGPLGLNTEDSAPTPDEISAIMQADINLSAGIRSSLGYSTGKLSPLSDDDLKELAYSDRAGRGKF